MAEYWPTADAHPSAPTYEVEFARIWKSMPKVLFSQTLEKVEWNSRLVRDDIAAEVTRLKEQPGKDMSVGGPTLAATLIRHGLIDEYQPFVHSVCWGVARPISRRWTTRSTCSS
jgi:dihydrofolate reductase